MTRRFLTQLFAIFGGFREPWAKHCLNVARLSKNIAIHIGSIDPKYAFLYGLVHDIGRVTPRSHKDPRYHCVDGFLILEMLEKNARKERDYISALLFSNLKFSPLTHSFPDLLDLSLVPGYYNPLWDADVTDKAKYKISGIWDVFIPYHLKEHEPDLYDTIVCIADLMSDSSTTITIERRLTLVRNRYGKHPKEKEIIKAIQKDVEIIEWLTDRRLYEILKEMLDTT